jgi:hypothetical protein
VSDIDTSGTLYCLTCGDPATTLYSATEDRFDGEFDQWYECAQGHPSKKSQSLRTALRS